MDTAQARGRPVGRRAWEFNREAAIRARVAKGWSAGDLSDRCVQLGVGKVWDSNIVKYERGDICPSPRTLRALAAALELPIDSLMVVREAA